MNNHAFVAVAVVGGLLALTPGTRAAQLRFYGVGVLPGTRESVVPALSRDGNTAAGLSLGDRPVGFLWSAGTGLRSVQGPESWLNPFGLDADGDTAVGTSNDRATRWVGGNPEYLSGVGSNARAASADGSIVVGDARIASVPRAVRWTSAGEQQLGSLIPGGRSVAVAPSADGSVVVGQARNAAGFSEAFRWTESGGMVSLGILPGGRTSFATGVSEDGSVVVGMSGASSRDQAFRWTAATGMVALGAPGPFAAIAFCVSADGNTIGGQTNMNSSLLATIWRPDLGNVLLQPYLEHLGLDLSEWTLTETHAISADGLTLAGTGYHTTEDRYEGFVVTIPTPSWLATLSAASLWSLRRRRSR